MNKSIENVVVAGISFKTTELLSRSRFAFNAEACRDAYNDAVSGLPFFILSTCNRTEIYSWSTDVEPLMAILSHQGQCKREELTEVVYIKRGAEAVNHFFRVAAGLESQIVGDYDIISQIKTAFKGAKDNSRPNGILEKMFNYALQASKEVKNETSFSDGTLSVPYAVVRQLLGRTDVKNVTVVGAGETGELMIKYLRTYLGNITIRLVNRDEDKLNSLASKYEVLQFPITSLGQSLIDTDVLIVATNASMPIVDRHHVNNNIKFIFDLSVPRNVGPAVYRMKNIMVSDVDAISETILGNMNTRLSQIPSVEKILARYSDEFGDWMKRREAFTV